VRISNTCAGGTHDSGNLPWSSSSRSSRASAWSVLALLTTPQHRGVRRLGQMHRYPGPGQLLGDEPPPGAALHREGHIGPVGETLRSQSRNTTRVAGRT
jgi:hypothetical protein